MSSKPGVPGRRSVLTTKRRRLWNRRLRRHRSTQRWRRQPGLLFEATPRGKYGTSRPTRTCATARAGAPQRKVSDGAWSAVLIIPLNVLRVAHGGKQMWWLQFVCRQIMARGEHLVWAWNLIMAATRPAATGRCSQNDTRVGPRRQLRLSPLSKVAAVPKLRADIYGLASIGEDRNLFQQANGQALLRERAFV